MKEPLGNSRKQLVKFIVCADPNPLDRVTRANPDGTVLVVDSNGPDIFPCAKFLEPQGRMTGVGREEPPRCPCA